MAFYRICCLFLCFAFSYLGANPYPYRFEGHFEEFSGKRLELIARFLPESPIILEAGAHFGTDTVKFIDQWPCSQILCFEPLPESYENLVENTRNFPQVETYKLALSNREGSATFYVCHGTEGLARPNELGASSLLPPSKDMEIHYKGPKIQVNCVVLDKWCSQQGVDHIDFMWLDMEGNELQALSSSPEILKTVKVIYTETNFISFRKGMTRYPALKAFLEKAGFVVLSHWYAQGFQGDAIFIKKELYDQLQ